MKEMVFLLYFLWTTAAHVFKSDHWSVLASTSKGYQNYRHQASVCHAYHIMRNRGIPEDQIIVFSYDDAVSDPKNPFPGKLFSVANGTDVYAGCKIDYRGENATSANFIKVLRGIGDGKVLKSTQNSNIFISTFGHGTTGFIYFNEFSDRLTAEDLANSLYHMYATRMYNKMVIYMEACHSASMFENYLNDDLNIYAVTSSTPHNSSVSWFWDDEAIINGTLLGTWLSDQFTAAWFADADHFDIWNETLDEQFTAIKECVFLDEIARFGDMSFLNYPAGEFIGSWDVVPKVSYNIISSKFINPYKSTVKNRVVKNRLDSSHILLKQRSVYSKSFDTQPRERK